MDRVVCLLVRCMIWLSRLAPFLNRMGLLSFSRWKAGEKLKVLLVGYLGSRNTGADARVKEIVLLLNHVLGSENISIGVLTQSNRACQEYFPQKNVTLIQISSIFFWGLFKACSTHHVALLCEGSTLKSKFANALTLFFCQASGMMANQNKRCIAFGSEAGLMDTYVRNCASKHCRDTFFIARSKQSLDAVSSMGLTGMLGTDTAWTFENTHQQWAREKLKNHGWDGSSPLLGLAVINPFVWPVYPSLFRFARGLMTQKWDGHYNKWYFFSSSPQRTKLFESYIAAIAATARDFASRHDAFPVIIGMEALDSQACFALQRRLGKDIPVFCSHEYNAFEIVGVLQLLSVLVTSRYHARVLSLPAAVPALAVSMDERLFNLYDQIGHLESFFFRVDDQYLRKALPASLEKLWANRDSVSEQLQREYPKFMESMGNMALFLHRYLTDHYSGVQMLPLPVKWPDALAYSSASRQLSQITDAASPSAHEESVSI